MQIAYDVWLKIQGQGNEHYLNCSPFGMKYLKALALPRVYANNTMPKFFMNIL